MFRKKSFESKKIGVVKSCNSYSKSGSNFFSLKGIFRTLVIVGCVILVGYFGKWMLSLAQGFFNQLGKGTVTAVSSTFGSEMKKDEFGNVNILLIGYGGDKHAGGYLADSIMVASWNPKLKTVTMISIPRDLYINKKEEKMYGKINSLYSWGVGRQHDFQRGADWMLQKVQEITNLKIPYYASIDFEGFKNVIDTLGGIQVYVEKPIVDRTYPDGHNGYMTFRVSSGLNNFNGDFALMYARSRHSSSDFSRSLRQQQIIKAIIDKVLSAKSITKIKQLYSDYQSMVHTNVTLQDMLGMAKYAYDIKNIYSFGYTTECSERVYRLSQPACFLYNPGMAAFGGASVSIPIGATPANVSFYEYTSNFANLVAHNQKYLIENAKIMIRNGIEKEYAKKSGKRSEGYANQIAVKLKKYAFNIFDTDNSPVPLAKTSIYISGSGDYTETIKQLRSFVPMSGDNIIGKFFTGDVGSGFDLVLILGNDYIDNTKGKPFNYQK